LRRFRRYTAAWLCLAVWAVLAGVVLALLPGAVWAVLCAAVLVSWVCYWVTLGTDGAGL
jgi:hypothetical protein